MSGSRENNFDLLRHVASVMVLVHHWRSLSGAPDYLPTDYRFGLLAVNIFFVISGLLVAESYLRSRSIGAYLEKRARRILPAYVTVVVLCAVAGVLLSDLSISRYFGSSEFWRYLLFNLGFLNFAAPSLPGVFVDNPHLSAVNGSLWTLKVEIAFYLCIPIIVWLGRKTNIWLVLVAVYLAGAAWHYVIWFFSDSIGGNLAFKIAKQLPGQAPYFAIGMLGCYLFRSRTPPAFALAAAGTILLAIVELNDSLALDALFRPAAVGMLTLGIGFAKPTVPVGRYGDVSYGIYLLHFPIIQTFVSVPNPLEGYTLLAACFATTVAGAFLMWHLVERPFLQSGSHYRVASADAPDQERS